MREANSKRVRRLVVLFLVLYGVFCIKANCKAAVKVTVREIKDGEVAEKEYTKKQFLKKCKCSKEKPIIQYYDENDKLQVEIYYNATAKKACGIRYKEDETQGFMISSINDAKGNKFDKYALKPENEENDIDTALALNGATNVKKSEKHNKAGKLTRYQVTGVLDEEQGKVSLVDIKFTYNKKGKLIKKEAIYNPFLYGTSNSVNTYYFNKNEQLIFKYGYLTHGSSENYYSYKTKKATTPEYEVFLDFMGDFLDGNLYIDK